MFGSRSRERTRSALVDARYSDADHCFPTVDEISANSRIIVSWVTPFRVETVSQALCLESKTLTDYEYEYIIRSYAIGCSSKLYWGCILYMQDEQE